MASAMTFHENYGMVTKAQLRAYKKYNVSPSDHDDLTREFGSDYDAITEYVIANAKRWNGIFHVFDLYLGR